MAPNLQAAINGGRTPKEHPRIPRAPEELARDARACVEAGARVVHLHPYDSAGRQTLEAEPCSRALVAVRSACPGIPISFTTSEEVAADPDRRLELISAWTELPDLVTANQGEAGITELCEHLLERGVGIEAGLLSVEDAEAFVDSGLADRCVRAMVEPLAAGPDQAVADGAAIEAVLTDAGLELEQVHHGDGLASWAVSKRALARRHGIRTGLEDTTVLPNGDQAADNAELVRMAAEWIAVGPL